MMILLVDYNESTPLLSPQSGDEESVLMGRGKDAEKLDAEVPIAPLTDATITAEVLRCYLPKT